MTKCVVIADEITGASAVGALLEKNKCSACSLMTARALKEDKVKKYDCLLYSTNSRHLTKEQSYQLVYYAAKLIKNKDIKIYSKRIDPSLRGNTCTEVQALLDALDDKKRVAIVVPSFPDLNRSTVGGYLIVNGRPMQKSLAGLDQITPSQHSGTVNELFTKKFRYKSCSIHLNELIKGREYISNLIQKLANDDVRAILFDSTTQEDINLIADSLLDSNIDFLAVDPGPFTATLARKITREKEKSNYKIFGIIGGNNPLISAQVEILRLEEPNAHFVTIRNKDLIINEQKRKFEILRVVNEIIKAFNEHTVCLLVSDHLGASKLQLKDFEDCVQNRYSSTLEALDIIATCYGQIAEQILSEVTNVKGIYTAGAEYTVALCRELKAVGLSLKGQVLPLSAFGELIDGEYEGLKVVTSAASATDVNTLSDCIQYLKRKLEI